MKRKLLPPVAAAVFLAVLSPAPAVAEEEHPAFAACQSCHRVGAGAKHLSGPQLNGLIGRKAGTVEGFHYSAGMKTAGEGGLVWTRGTLDRFLQKPQAFVKGTRMPFRGIEDAAERERVINYLEGFSQPGTPVADLDAGPCAAAVKSALAATADRDYGEYLAGECVTCHQVSGHQDGIPAITKLPREVFVKALCEYKIKHREHPVMNMVTGNLGDAEFAALAAYFATLD